MRQLTFLSPAQPQQQPVRALAVLLLVNNFAQEAIDDGPEQGNKQKGNNQLITIDLGGADMGRGRMCGVLEEANVRGAGAPQQQQSARR